MRERWEQVYEGLVAGERDDDGRVLDAGPPLQAACKHIAKLERYAKMAAVSGDVKLSTVQLILRSQRTDAAKLKEIGSVLRDELPTTGA